MIAPLNNKKIEDIKFGKSRFVVPYAKEWGIKIEGEKGITNIFPNKKEAVKYARKEAKTAHATLIIQNKNGEVEKIISYGAEKVPTKIETIKVRKVKSVQFN
ncbi:MAG: DUF2188 domain-containing protein [Flavobacteriales bacterium]